MLCAVYKSHKKADTYLFVEQRGNFSRVPEALLQSFGTPKLVMVTKLDPKRPLSISDTQKVMTELKERGFYLQLPPPVENLLEEHKRHIKASGASAQ